MFSTMRNTLGISKLGTLVQPNPFGLSVNSSASSRTTSLPFSISQRTASSTKSPQLQPTQLQQQQHNSDTLSNTNTAAPSMTPTTTSTFTSSSSSSGSGSINSCTSLTSGMKTGITNLWLTRMQKMKQCIHKQVDVEFKRRQIQSKEDVTAHKNTARSLCAGDVRLQAIRKLLDNVGIVRSSDQIAFHEAFIAACLPKIYKEEWSQHSVRVMREMKLKEIEYEVLGNIFF
jgi:hypothetical protein